MGELLLCNEAIAAMPYYIEGVSINVYSIEELNYYIINNTYLLDYSFPFQLNNELYDLRFDKQSLTNQNE